MYNLKIIKCNDDIEIYKTKGIAVREEKQEEFYRFIPKEKTYKGKQLNFEESKELEEKKEINKIKNRMDNLKKSKEKIIRLIKCNNDLSSFITLTYSNENMKDFKQSKKDIKKCFNKISRDCKKQGRIFKYLWVLEYSSSNRLHYHILCNYNVTIKLSKSNELKSEEHKKLENGFKNRYWQYGIVDIRSLKQENNTNIALYVSKYITKSMINKDLEGYRVYSYSKNLNKPIIEKKMSLEPIEDILKKYDSDYEIQYMSSYSIGYDKKRGIMTYANLNKRSAE